MIIFQHYYRIPNIESHHWNYYCTSLDCVLCSVCVKVTEGC